VTANASGSSRLSNNRFAPSGGLGWNIDKEKFFKKNSVIQLLRLRATTGIVGNQNFAAFLGTPVFQYNIQNDYRLQLGAALQGYANPDLKWQQTLKSNLGLAAGLFNGRLNISLEYYQETTDNLILPSDVAPSTGFELTRITRTKKRYELSVTAPDSASRKISSVTIVHRGAHDNVALTFPAISAEQRKRQYEDKKSPAKYEVGESSCIWAVRSQY
jgi:hypothetical protein